MRGADLLLVLQIGLGAVGGLAIPTPAQSRVDWSLPESTATTISAISPTTSATSISTSIKSFTPISTSTLSSSFLSSSPSSSYTPSAKSTSLYLAVNASPPDPLGISKVSGFYGPGAWAAWFLTIVASWMGCIRGSTKKIDANTVLFLLGTNWAAVDVFRSIHALRSVGLDGPEYKTEFAKGMGNYAAAFTVVFWGTAHALLQLAFGVDERRARKLVVGLVLPLIALTATVFGPIITGMGGNALNFFPALYWKGMGDAIHGLLIVMAAATAIFLVVPLIGYLYNSDTDKLPKSLLNSIAVIKGVIFSETANTILGLYVMVSLITLLVSLVLCIARNDQVYLWGMAPFFILFSPILMFSGPMGWLTLMPGSIVVYIVKGYLRLGSNSSESCFFMPCAPQNIKEEDQLYSLLAGLLALGVEVAPRALKALREKYRDRRLFVQYVEGRLRQFEMRRRTTTAPSS